MRILVTGSEGVLGSVLKNTLREQGHEVWGCDRNHNSDPQFIRVDIAEARQVDRVFAKAQPELVFHLAAEFGRKNGQEYYEQLWKSNCIGTRNTIEACLRHNATLVFSSSSEAYGMASQYTVPGESLREELLDHNPPQFHNEYALSKWTNERQIYTSAVNDGLRAIVLRFFNVYGPGEYFSPYRSVACQFMYRALSSMPVTVHKDSSRSHLYAGDWVDTMARIPDRLEPIFRIKAGRWYGSGTSGVPVFNIGSDELVANEELWAEVQKLVPDTMSEVTFKEAEKSNLSTKIANSDLASLWLGHAPVVPLAEGLQRTRDWMREVYGL